jgi:hypothetical protein
MASGGARAKSGPPPDPNALRRDRPSDAAEWVELPAAGREGDPPVWPLADEFRGEAELWAREWRRPQAVMWERNGQELEVALFVRAICVAEGSKATAADRNVVQRKMTDLGITVPGLRANRWRIVQQTESKQQAATRGRGAGARERFQVVQGGS